MLGGCSCDYVLAAWKKSGVAAVHAVFLPRFLCGAARAFCSHKNGDLEIKSDFW